MGLKDASRRAALVAEASTGDADIAVDPLAIAHGFGDFLTLGHLAELQAGVQAMLPDPSGAANERLKADGFLIDEPSRYTSSLASFNKELDDYARERPLSYALGGSAGSGVFGRAVTIPLAKKALLRLRALRD